MQGSRLPREQRKRSGMAVACTGWAAMGLIAKLPRLQPPSGELPHLDLMRFVAAAGIVFHHSHEFFVPATKSPFLIREQWEGLALFVDLFFLISGFVIAYLYHNRMNSAVDYGKFLQRRIGRLVPLHWLTLILSITMWSMFVLLRYADDTPTFAAGCIAETALLLHSFLPCGRAFNSITWSLSAEMVMYIGFPFVALIGARRPRLLLGIGLSILAVMMTAAISQREWKFSAISWVGVSPVLRALPSFVCGAALFYNRNIVSKLPEPGLILAAAMAGSIAAMISGMPQLVVLLIIYLVAIAAVAADTAGVSSAPVRRFAPLGQLTYSIYMWHLLVILIFINVAGSNFPHAHGYSAAIIGIVCYLSILIISYLSFFYIETPARRWIDGINLFKPGLNRTLPRCSSQH